MRVKRRAKELLETGVQALAELQDLLLYARIGGAT